MKDQSGFLSAKTLEVTIAFDPLITSSWIQESLARGTYERIEGLAICRTVRDGDRVLDIGAGIGFTSALASRCGANAIFAFEPDARLIPALNETLRLNGIINVEIFNQAVVAQGELVNRSLYLREGFWSNSLRGDAPYHAVATCEVIHIERVLKSFSPNVIICDCEGDEFDLLLNVRNSCVRAIIVEIHHGKRCGDNVQFSVPGFDMVETIDQGMGSRVAIYTIDQSG